MAIYSTETSATIPLKNKSPSRTRKLALWSENQEKRPIRTNKKRYWRAETGRRGRGGRETKAYFSCNNYWRGENPVDHILGIMTLQIEEQAEAQSGADFDLST